MKENEWESREVKREVWLPLWQTVNRETKEKQRLCFLNQIITCRLIRKKRNLMFYETYQITLLFNNCQTSFVETWGVCIQNGPALNWSVCNKNIGVYPIIRSSKFTHWLDNKSTRDRTDTVWIWLLVAMEKRISQFSFF